MVLSALDATEVAGDGAGDALVLFEKGSPEEGELMLTGWGRGFFPSMCRVEGRFSFQYCGVKTLGSSRESRQQCLQSSVSNVI